MIVWIYNLLLPNRQQKVIFLPVFLLYMGMRHIAVPFGWNAGNALPNAAEEIKYKRTAKRNIHFFLFIGLLVKYK